MCSVVVVVSSGMVLVLSCSDGVFGVLYGDEMLVNCGICLFCVWVYSFFGLCVLYILSVV